MRKWFTTWRKPPQHAELAKMVHFSGDAFDQRAPILEAVAAVLDEFAAQVQDKTVWRLGQLRIRIRVGHAESDAERELLGEEEQVIPLIGLADAEPCASKSAHHEIVECPHCQGEVDFYTRGDVSDIQLMKAGPRETL
jgi:hypothetical protein